MELYYMPTCPHCHRVISWIESEGIQDDFEFIDVTASERNARRVELVEGGEGYVPCLADGDRTIIGDGPIIEYLERRLSRLTLDE